MGEDVMARFMKHVEKQPDDGCWLWKSGLYSNGYAKFKLATGETGGRNVSGHRFSYEHHIGPIAGVINHLCEVKHCVRPSHLEDVTQKENLRFSLSDYCKRGHDLVNGDVYISRQGKRMCRECRRVRRALATPRLGDIGEPIRHIELEPLEEPSRREAPVPSPARVPSPEPEKVPA